MKKSEFLKIAKEYGKVAIERATIREVKRVEKLIKEASEVWTWKKAQVTLKGMLLKIMNAEVRIKGFYTFKYIESGKKIIVVKNS